MYKIFQENKALVFPKIEGNSLVFDATPQESDKYDAELLCDFFPEWLDDCDPGDTFIHEVGENAVALALKETFRMAPAAGGIIVKDGKIVTIVRKGIPDLPKGHIEKGETPEVAALREVEEETGIGNLKIVKELPSTWHCYFEHEAWSLKRTYWYLMSTTDAVQPKPQTEEGITEIKLIGNEEIEDFLKNTFRNISEILGKELRQIISK
ncbi:MAG: NUDIX domain-containing protein [Bacteroidales bacterium]|jgi:8-oxo-dGTP pyrophosphatase MutT (NUDIX family)|nr:NUDIX domain-containing protein [Bacteroidales bacterium]